MNGIERAAAMRSAQRAYGTLITSPSPHLPERLRNLGLDFVFIDTEHIPNDRQNLSWMCRAYQAASFPPIVRVPNPDPFEACKVPDAGASGILFPSVQPIAHIRHLVGACRHPPLHGPRLHQALDDPATPQPHPHHHPHHQR